MAVKKIFRELCFLIDNPRLNITFFIIFYIIVLKIEKEYPFTNLRNKKTNQDKNYIKEFSALHILKILVLNNKIAKRI